MRILFVDDDRDRHRAFRRAHPEGHRAVCAASYSEAVELLRNHGFDALFLDHDLDVRDTNCDPAGPTHAKTGTDLARWIAAHKHPAAFDVHLHSLNNRGVASMTKILGEAGFAVHVERFLELVARLNGRPLHIISGAG